MYFYVYIAPSHHCRGCPKKQQRKGAASKLPEIPSGPGSLARSCSAALLFVVMLFISFIDKADSANVPQHREVERTLSATSSFLVCCRNKTRPHQGHSKSSLPGGTFTMPPTLFYHKQIKKKRGTFFAEACSNTPHADFTKRVPGYSCKKATSFLTLVQGQISGRQDLTLA